jgi:hypothetical protein
VTGYHKQYSLFPSDTYDVYYMNPGLLPPVHAEPAEYPPGNVWTLERDATVEDICDFIVQFINSDVTVCSNFVFVIWCSFLHFTHRAC